MASISSHPETFKHLLHTLPLELRRPILDFVLINALSDAVASDVRFSERLSSLYTAIRSTNREKENQRSFYTAITSIFGESNIRVENQLSLPCLEKMDEVCPSCGHVHRTYETLDMVAPSIYAWAVFVEDGYKDYISIDVEGLVKRSLREVYVGRRWEREGAKIEREAKRETEAKREMERQREMIKRDKQIQRERMERRTRSE
jgi:hypothetical protein